METSHAPKIPEPTASPPGRACADTAADDEYTWVGYEAAHPVPALFVLPIEDGSSSRYAR